MSPTVAELVAEVRAQCDESNTIDVTTDKILAALNRGQRKAANIVSRRYDELFWDSTTIPTVAGQRDYAIPASAYGRRIEHVEVITSGNLGWEVKKLANEDRTPYITNSQSTRPMYYSQKRNTIQLYPKPNGTYDLEIHYARAPERLVMPQGRVSSINSVGNYVLVDGIGTALGTTITDFEAWVNVVDYVTGDIKATLQILSLDPLTNQVVFRTTGLTRTTVLGRTVSTSIPTTISADDYICGVAGTCVPELDGAYTDYLTQYAVLDIKRAHQEVTAEEYAALKELGVELEQAWSGREQTLRVKKTSDHWTNRIRAQHNRLLV